MVSVTLAGNRKERAGFADGLGMNTRLSNLVAEAGYKQPPDCHRLLQPPHPQSDV